MQAQTPILILEDNIADIELIQRELRNAGLNFIAHVAQDKAAFLKLLDEIVPAIILADYSIPGYDGLAAMAEAKKRFPDVCVIIVSGVMGEDFAIETIKAGATDYVLKRNLKRLGHAIKRALEEAEQIEYKKQAEVALRDSRQAALNLMTDAVEARRQAEQAREEWVETFNLMPDLIAILDEHHKIARVNKAMAEKLGVTPEQAVGLSCYRCVHDADKPPAACPHALMLNDHKFHIAEVHEPNLGGDFIVSVTPMLDKNGKVRGGVHVARDITERKQRERDLQKLNQMLKAQGKSSQAMVQATDETEYLNQVCKIVIDDCDYAMAWIGYAEDDENKTVRPVAYSGFEEGYLQTMKLSWADTERGRGPTGTAIRTGTVAICKNILTDPAFEPWRTEALKRGYASSIVFPLMENGKAFGVMAMYSKLPDPFTEGEIALLSELTNDLAHGIIAIRLHKKVEELNTFLKRRADELTAANSEMEAFSYSVAHDLRNPLQSITALLCLFTDESKARMDETEREALKRIEQAVCRMASVISDLLTLSKISQQQIQRGTVDLSAIVREIFDEMKTTEPSREVTLEIKSECAVEADTGLTRILIENILRNAWKFTSKSPDARIEFGTVAPSSAVAGTAMEGEGDLPQVCYLRDNGTGFDMAKAEGLFKPFQRLHSDKEFTGTGIGLAIVQRIINKHGGKIWAQGEVGKGATFFFSLPLTSGIGGGGGQ